MATVKEIEIAHATFLFKDVIEFLSKSNPNFIFSAKTEDADLGIDAHFMSTYYILYCKSKSFFSFKREVCYIRFIHNMNEADYKVKLEKFISLEKLQELAPPSKVVKVATQSMFASKDASDVAH